ncbi:MAG: glycosyltransferase [Candidatus Coprovivens sp.]
MKKIVFYNKTLISGGIEKCIESLSKYIYKDYELEVCYIDDSILDPNIVNIISKYAKVTKLEDGMSIECDICVWAYLYFDYYKIKNMIHAKEYICWIHSMPRILPDCLLDNKDFVNDCSRFICVSEAVKNNLNISKEGEVIHNFMNDNLIELSNESNPLEDVSSKVLKLCVCSRLSSGKGFDRLELLVKALERKNVNYILNIIGKGRKRELEIRETFSKYDKVKFIGYRDNPYNYVKNSDYLIQLSDDESWCNSITEAKLLNTPVVVTKFLSSFEQIEDGYNGIMVDLNCNDYDYIVDRMINELDILNENLKGFKYENELNKWLEIFNG